VTGGDRTEPADAEDPPGIAPGFRVSFPASRDGPAETGGESVDVCTHSRTVGLAVPVESDGDGELRAAAFLYIDRQRAVYGDRSPWKVLPAFEFNGQRRVLITQRGIRWISGMPALTFTTTYSPDPTQAPYADGVGEERLADPATQATCGAS
jgi:hypothetical protein